MTRREFTKQIVKLIQEMIDAGEQPIIDWVMRNEIVQKYMYDHGLSKCDGTIKISNHQKGIAMDLYLCHINSDGSVSVDFEWIPEKAEKWHKRWEELGGREMFAWDKGHFE